MTSRVSLSSRLTRWYIGTFLVILGGGLVATWLLVDNILDRRIDDELIEDARELAGIYSESGLDGLRGEITDELRDEESGAEFYRVVDLTGAIVFEAGISQYRSADNTGNVAQWKAGTTEEFRLLSSDQTVDDGDEPGELTYREIIFPLSAANKRLLLHLGESTEHKSEVMDTLTLAFSTMLFLIIPVAGLIGWRVVRRNLQGVEEISDIARRIQRGHMDERVLIQPGDLEVDQLAGTFNTMLDCIHDLVVEMQEMTDNIAHDLKGPIARIRFMSEIALSKNLSDEEQADHATKTIDECERLMKMIDLSLDVAEAEAGITPSGREQFDLSEQIQDACELFSPVAEQKQISLHCDIQPGCGFYGNQGAIQRMIANLVDNALKYCDPGDQVEVKFRTTANHAQVEVSDSGIGISEQDQRLVFNRFFRCDRSRSREGCGLGLSFSRAVARQYGGEITVTSAPGRGSVFSLILPRGSDHPAVSVSGGVDPGGEQFAINRDKLTKRVTKSAEQKSDPVSVSTSATV